jgi:hypothetical protein
MGKTELASGEEGHYVYLYRNPKGKALYVGYGANHRRATIHSSRSHNKTLESFLRKNKYTVDIAGPFLSKTTGCAVETALISVLRPEFNVHPGSTECRFRPLGLPNDFADRVLLPALSRRDVFRHIGRSESVTSVLLVYVGDKEFEDGRKPYNPANPPKEDEILERMDRWWQIGRHIEHWRKNASESPAVLIGLSGPPKDRFIIGAIKIYQVKWDSVDKDGGLYSIPTTEPNDLDAFGLRGRKISPEANLKFGGWTSQFFIILKRNGRVIGGG